MAEYGGDIRFGEDVVDWIVKFSVGYPYFLQYLAKGIFDGLANCAGADIAALFENAANKLDVDFFQARWLNIPDRQREFLRVVAWLDNRDTEFTGKEIAEMSRKMLRQPFKPSRVNQILQTLSATGLVYKNSFGKYSFAVPLLGEFIRRQAGSGSS